MDSFLDIDIYPVDDVEGSVVSSLTDTMDENYIIC